jgi:hypothetical protein
MNSDLIIVSFLSCELFARCLYSFLGEVSGLDSSRGLSSNELRCNKDFIVTRVFFVGLHNNLLYRF